MTEILVFLTENIVISYVLAAVFFICAFVVGMFLYECVSPYLGLLFSATCLIIFFTTLFPNEFLSKLNDGAETSSFASSNLSDDSDLNRAKNLLERNGFRVLDGK